MAEMLALAAEISCRQLLYSTCLLPSATAICELQAAPTEKGHNRLCSTKGGLPYPSSLSSLLAEERVSQAFRKDKELAWS